MDVKMFTDLLTPIVGLGTVLVGLGTAIVGITKYFNYRSERDRIRLIGDAFEAVIASLRSDNPVERMAAAIRLRRFYDRKREMGTGREAPYAKVAVDVAVAILRSQPTSDFQKVLADGLGFAPNLQRADLQRTNLQFAYLGARRKEDGEEGVMDLSYADFYRADLSRASLKRANAPYAVFYQARLHNTVFKGANLAGADFFDADLGGAVLDGAILKGANFSCARHLPLGIREQFDEKGLYRDDAPFRPPVIERQNAECAVFVSKPGCLTPIQKVRLETTLSKLRENGLLPKALERPDYPQFGAIGEVRRLLRGCKGALILGFPELTVRSGTWRAGTPEETELKNFVLPTAWVQIEAGMAAMAGLPVFVMHEDDLKVGVFGVEESETGFYRARIDNDCESASFDKAFSNWLADVREVSRSETSLE
ncbi:MAG: pentapeptide repeat-containing protein [Bryobacteraceae bacterium]